MNTVSKAQFVNDAKNVILHNEFISVRNADKLTERTSFRDVLDMTSLDIATLIIALEEKYHVDMQWAMDGIDNIDDVYALFLRNFQKTTQRNISQSQKQR